MPTTQPRRSAPYLVGAATILAALCLLFAGLSPAGSTAFFVLSLLAAAIYLVASSTIPSDIEVFPRHRVAADLALGAAVGAGLLAVFCAGALIVVQVPLLSSPVRDLLENTQQGALLPALAVTAINGVAEELFYRRAVPSAFSGTLRRRLIISLLLYMGASAMLGVPLLVFAAVVIGASAHWMIHRGRSVSAAIIMHLVWSLGMALLLPVFLPG